MREITETQRSGPAARDRKRPVSDALSVTVARIVSSRAVIDQSRARAEAAAARLAARSAEIAAGPAFASPPDAALALAQGEALRRTG